MSADEVQKLRHAADLARGDLCFMLNHPDLAYTEHCIWRPQQAIKLLTEALGDGVEFAKQKAKWDAQV